MEHTVALRLPPAIATFAEMPRRPNSEKRLKKLSAPASAEEIEEYFAACKIADIAPADTLRKLAKALSAHVREHKQVSFPLRLEAPRSQK